MRERDLHPEEIDSSWIILDPKGKVQEVGFGKKYGEHSFNGLPTDANEVLIIETETQETATT